MATYRSKSNRDPLIEVLSRKEEEEVEIDSSGPIYDDTMCVIENDTSFH
jgi:hypothetical protein